MTSALDLAIPNALPGPPPPTSEDSHVKSDCESLIPHTDLFTNTTLPDSRAIVAVPPIKVEALAVVPVNQKIRRTDIAQRRTRRPFSVSEVEALVQAVEELGTGRCNFLHCCSFLYALLIALSLSTWSFTHNAGGVMLNCVLLRIQIIELMWT